MLRRKALGAVLLAVAVVAAPAARAGGGGSTAPPLLEIFYTSPILAVADETVQVPVDVVCTTDGGEPCTARVVLSARVPGEAWRVAAAAAAPGLRFDLTAVAAAAAAGGSAAVEFRIDAAADGAVAGIPEAAGETLRFHVVGSVSEVALPRVRFDAVRRGTPRLILGWGSGRRQVALAVGAQADTSGPPSFDVDAMGRIHVLDGLRDRLLTFAAGDLVREARVRATERADLAVARDGRTAFLVDVEAGRASLRTLGPRGAGAQRDLGPALAAQVRTIDDVPAVGLLPLDAWRVATAAGPPAPSTPGRPVGPGVELLRVAREGSVRIGVVSRGTVTDAFELRTPHRFGEVALTERLPGGDVLVVVRVWRSSPPGDAFQVIRLRGHRVVEAFTAPSRTFASIPPPSRFRLGGDGLLYQMRTTPAGLRIVSYDLKEER